ncbi:MAG: hypothetical protein GX652_03490 [Burkholderiaceae bacterium]|nr:hypothetical protein [Burkholderiaceae bacterium]
MKRLSLLASAILLSLATTPTLATAPLPKPTEDAYALASQALAAAALPSATAAIAVLPAPISNASLAGTLAPAAESQLKVASIGNVLGTGGSGASTSARQPASEAPGGRLPSTPVALAALLLMICILIGRRNRPEDI